MEKKKLIVNEGVYYRGIMQDIRKSKDPLRPLLEVLTNSLESLKLIGTGRDDAYIEISIYKRRDLEGNTSFVDQIVVEDNGMGFDEENFNRMNRYKDNRKGFSNKGSGRIQLLHFFDRVEYDSVFKQENDFKNRKFILSKHYLNDNAIISDYSLTSVNTKNSSKTIARLVKFEEKRDEKFYQDMVSANIKDLIISKYIMEFCNNKEHMPLIKIKHYIDGNLEDEEIISEADVPEIDKSREIELEYYKLSSDSKEFFGTGKKEKFTLSCFKINSNDLKKNEIKLVSKGEIVELPKISLESLSPKDQLNGNRYLFLVSGDYIDSREGDARGSIDISTREEVKKKISETDEMFQDEEIFLEDLKSETNSAVLNLYDEIKQKKLEKRLDINRLKDMFLLKEKTLNSLSISINDTEEKILEKVYVADSKEIAKRDAEIKKCIDLLNDMDTTSEQYKIKFDALTKNLVELIPMQNKNDLTHYVARRKLVLELFSKILKREIDRQNDKSRNIDEQLLHNLIFQQSSSKPEESDLWLVNEDFIYFKGTSDKKLSEIEIDGIKFFKKEVTEEEEEYINSLGENRRIKKPDVLLFPDEGKCIIIEFKNTNTNVSIHLNQINRYASLVRNFSREDLQIDTFFGYLIGEKISAEDIRDYDADFKPAYHFDYVFRPLKTIAGKFGRKDGYLYTEVIKYSTLLERAKRRNDIFISKLTHKSLDYKHIDKTDDNIEIKPKKELSLSS